MQMGQVIKQFYAPAEKTAAVAHDIPETQLHSI